MLSVLLILVTDFEEYSGNATKGKILLMLDMLSVATGMRINLFCVYVFSLAMDRYVALKYALKHRIWVTKRITRMALALSWILSLISMLLLVLATTVNRRMMTKIFVGMNLCCSTVCILLSCEKLSKNSARKKALEYKTLKYK